MRRALIAAVPVVAVILSAPALAAGAGPPRASVKPGSGTPRTHFIVSFRVPVAAGTFGSVTRRDTVSITGPRRAGCVSGAARTVRRARKGSRARLTFSPGRRSWCAGSWRGTIVQSLTLRCRPGPARACPQLVIAPRTLARFRFSVTAPSPPAGPTPPAGDVPTFAGLLSATACTTSGPAPQLLPQPARYTLSWNAATDPLTPSSGIVYDIFLATRPGGENYAQATWTTSSGATSYVTPAIPRNGAVYFVVRARNTAGGEDANTVERQGLIACPPTP